MANDRISRGSGATANVADIADLFDQITSLCDMTGPGSSGSFGADLANIAADGMKARADRQTAPDGSTWEANRGDYGKAKRAKGIPVGVGLRESTYRMLDRAELLGEVEVTPDQAVMTPGTTGGVRQKIEWFSDGNEANNQPPRELVGLDSEIEGKLADRVERQIVDGINRLGG